MAYEMRISDWSSDVCSSDLHAPGIPDPPVALPSSAALTGPDHAADAIYGAPAMAPAREIVRKEHGDIKSGMILIDQLEAVIGKGKDGYAWDAQGWYGGDIDRLWEIGRAHV